MLRNLSFLMFFIFCSMSFAQEDPEVNKTSVLSLYAIGSEGYGVGGMVEYSLPKNELINKNFWVYIRGGIENYKKDFSGTGNGQSIAFGTRTYYLKNKPHWGLFSGNEIKYSSIKFSKDSYKGRYSYFSVFNPEIGYRFAFGKQRNIALELFGGVEWAIEVKGKGDVDNKDFSNWKPKVGIALNFCF